MLPGKRRANCGYHRSGRASVGIRVKRLGTNYCFKRHFGQTPPMKNCAQAGVEEAECAFVDDVVGFPVMVRCRLPVAVPDAHWFYAATRRLYYETRGRRGCGAQGNAI